MNILICEDDEVIQLLYKEFLKDDNLCITETGKDAIQNARTKQFDMLILDINLPDINGFDVAEIILDKQETAVLVSSANEYKSQINKLKYHSNCLICDFHLKGIGLNEKLRDFKQKLSSIKEAKKISNKA